MTDLVADQRIVVVGAGQAGFAACAKLRSLGHRGAITLIGEEALPPYQRPPLSKAYVLGEMARERLFLRPAEFYVDQDINFLTHTTVTDLNADLRVVTLSDQRKFGYDNLILATGAAPIRLSAALGGDLTGVHYMRDLADADRLAQDLLPGRHVVIVGGGYIGLEAAAVARKLGLEVTLLEAGARILNRVAAVQTADFFRELHSARGVRILESCRLKALTGNAGRVTAAVLANGEVMPCDLVIVGIGVRPNQALAEHAGLAIDNGIKTDSQCRTSVPDIFAVGDCASFPWQEGRIRLESVGNAIDQAETVAAVIMGRDVTYTAKPWFWSDQYEVKLQIAGLSTGHDDVVIREGINGSRSHWYYSTGKLIAVDALNDPRGYMIAKRLIEAGRSPDKRQVADPEIDLKALL